MPLSFALPVFLFLVAWVLPGATVFFAALLIEHFEHRAVLRAEQEARDEINLRYRKALFPNSPVSPAPTIRATAAVPSRLTKVVGSAQVHEVHIAALDTEKWWARLPALGVESWAARDYSDPGLHVINTHRSAGRHSLMQRRWAR